MIAQQLRDKIEKSYSLSNNEWRAIEQKLHIKKIPKRRMWLKSGEVCRNVAFIVSGAMHCFIQEGNKEVTSHLLFEGMFSADFRSFMLQTPSLHTVETLEEAVVILIGSAELKALQSEIPSLNKFVLQTVNQLLISEMQRSASLLLKSPDERYLDLMSTLPQALQRVPQYILASYLNITPETLSRVRNRIRYNSRYRLSRSLFS